MALTHPARGDAEFTLTVYCPGIERMVEPSPGNERTVERSHEDERTVDVLGYWPTPPGHFGFLNWLTAGESLQTPFSEKLNAELRTGKPVDLGGWSGTPKDMNFATRWRFECEDCCTLPVNGQKMEPILDRLREHAVQRISLPQISARLTM